MNDLIKDCRVTGELLFGGENIYDRDVDVVAIRKNIGMVFQKPNPFPMSIYDNIAYGPRVHGIRGKHKLDEVVETSLVAAALWDEVSDKLDIAARSEWRAAAAALYRTNTCSDSGCDTL
jgi:phosphate transport system ATP-binding protein